MVGLDKVLIIVRGLPGSGKSSFAEQISQNDVYIEADQFWFDEEGNYNFDVSRIGEAHYWCQQHVDEWMCKGFPQITVSNTSTTEKELESYYYLAEKYGYKVYSLIMENRHNGVNCHNVPDQTLDKMRSRFSVKL